MQYLCLCYYDVQRFMARTPAQLEELGRECRPHDEALHKSGHLLAVGSLGQPEESACLRPVNGKATRVDGPFVQTNEPPGAFLLIEAKDLDEAVQIASLHPSAALIDRFGGGIEIWPIDRLEQL